MELLQKQATNRRLYFIERQYVSYLLFVLPFFFLSSYSEERTKVVQYIFHQREQIEQLTNEKHSVNISSFIHILHFHLFL
jgi:hypothetical protein